MKKATQYVFEHFQLTKQIEEWDDFDNIRYYSNKFPPNTNNLLMGEVYNLIKKVQEDAIRETVEECAKNAELDWDFVHGAKIDKNSILSIADKLIKEL